MRRSIPALFVLVILAVLAAFVFRGHGGNTPTSAQQITSPETEEAEMDQARSPKLEQSLAAFRDAGATEILPLLEAIAETDRDLAPLLDRIAPEAMSRVYSPVPTRHAGDQSSALVFAFDAGNVAALEDMIAAGADPAAGGGLLAQVAARHFTGSILDRDWGLSVSALNLYLAAGGDPTFASVDDNLPLFVVALQNGNLPGAETLLRGGADIWARTRRQGQRPGVIAVMDNWPSTIEFMAVAAESGAFESAPADALDQVVGFYVDGYLNEDRTGPDRSFPHAGTAGMASEPDKADLVVRLLRALAPIDPDNPEIGNALAIAASEGR